MYQTDQSFLASVFLLDQWDFFESHTHKIGHFLCLSMKCCPIIPNALTQPFSDSDTCGVQKKNLLFLFLFSSLLNLKTRQRNNARLDGLTALRSSHWCSSGKKRLGCKQTEPCPRSVCFIDKSNCSAAPIVSLRPAPLTNLHKKDPSGHKSCLF